MMTPPFSISARPVFKRSVYSVFIVDLLPMSDGGKHGSPFPPSNLLRFRERLAQHLAQTAGTGLHGLLVHASNGKAQVVGAIPGKEQSSGRVHDALGNRFGQKL